jgi:hypothetical protein
MNQMNFDPWGSSEYQRRHDELMQEAEQYRMAMEVSRSDRAKTSGISKILVMIGEEITEFGRSLDERNRSEHGASLTITQRSSTDGCT